jgi:HSP20 family protein
MKTNTMTTLTKSKSLLPTWTGSLFDNGRLLSPRMLDLNGDYLPWDYVDRIPSVNINENEKEFSIEMAAPGLEKKDFKVEVEKGTLRIRSERELETTEEEPNYSRKEYSYNSFQRSFALPENCYTDKINAKYDKGILHVSIPKKEVTVSKATSEIPVF